MIKNGCQSKLLKVKTAWSPNSSSLSFRFPVFRISTHNEGPFEISCTIDIGQGFNCLELKKIILILPYAYLSEKSYPASSCPNNGENEVYQFELPDIKDKVSVWT